MARKWIIRRTSKRREWTGGSDLGEPVRRAGLQPTLSAVAHSLRSNRASDGRQGPEPQASAELLFGLCGGRDMNVAFREGGVQNCGIEWCR
jgi:hypothetical protein